MRDFNRTFALLILILGFAAGFMYYTKIASTNAQPIAPAPINPNDNLSSFKEFSLDFSFIGDKSYQELKTFGEFPVSPGQVGKRDIFAPF